MRVKKQLTENYKNYTFCHDDFNEEPPIWLDDYDIFMGEIKTNESGIPYILPMVYTYYDKSKHPLYVGKSEVFNNRVKQHERAKEKGAEPWMNEVMYCGLIWCETLEEMDVVEILEIQKKKPRYSRDNCRDAKEYLSPIFGRRAYDIKTFYTEEIFPYEKLFK